MNRRQFTRGLASLGLMPTLPMPAMGGGATVATATATADKMYFMGWYTARMKKVCSPEILVSELNVDPSVAREIFSKLIKTNTVTAPNALGVSRAVDPLGDSYRRATRKAAHRALRKPSARKPLKPAQTISEDQDTQIEDPLDQDTDQPPFEPEQQIATDPDTSDQDLSDDTECLTPEQPKTP